MCQPLKPKLTITEKCFATLGSEEVFSSCVAATPVVTDPAIPKKILLDKRASI